MCSKADDPAYLSMQEADMSAPLNRDGVTGERSEDARDRARTALARAIERDPLLPWWSKTRADPGEAAEAWIGMLQADSDAARAVVALLGGEGREERAGNLSTKSGGGSSGSLDAGEDRYPKPAHFDKFTDEQFDAYIEGTGFGDRIRAALAESRAPQDDREAEHRLADEDLRAALDAGFEAADHFVRKYGLANTSGEKHATRKAGRDALLRVIEAARATLARTREPAGEGTR